MIFHIVRAAALAAAFISSAAAQPSARLPEAMPGVWAPGPEACGDNAMRDSRLSVSQVGVEFFASNWHVRVWQQHGNQFRGRAAVSEEGEPNPLPGVSPIGLSLKKDGRLEIRRHGGAANVFVKCPAGVRMR